MELAPSGIPLSFEVTFDEPDLDVAMTVYDDTGAEPVLLLSPFAMTLVYGNTYRGKFTPAYGKSYIIIKAVYTDGTFGTLDENYAQGSESLIALYSAAANVETLVGIVDSDETISGQVIC